MQTDPTRLAFNGVLGIRTIEAMHATVKQTLADHAAIQLDCSAAESVDLSFIQLLLAAKLSARNAGATLDIIGGDALAYALACAGVQLPP